MNKPYERPEQYDVFVSYAHADDKDGWVSLSAEWMLKEAKSLDLIIDESEQRHLLNDPPRHPPANAQLPEVYNVES